MLNIYADPFIFNKVYTIVLGIKLRLSGYLNKHFGSIKTNYNNYLNNIYVC